MSLWVYFLTLIVRPAAQVVFFGVMARFITGSPDVSFQVVGNTIQVCVLVSLYTVADALSLQRRNGTLILVALAPRGRFLVFASQIWLTGLHGLVVSVIAFAVGMVGFSFDISGIRYFPLLLSFLTGVFATSCLGTALGSFGLYLTDINLVGSIITSLMLIVCGVNFPTEALPAFLRALGSVLPMTRSVAAAHLAVAGAETGCLPLLSAEVVVGLTWLAIGFAIYAWAEHRARKFATLELE